MKPELNNLNEALQTLNEDVKKGNRACLLAYKFLDAKQK